MNKTLLGTDRSLYPRNPLVKSSSSRLGREGVPLGVQDNGEPFLFDPWLLKSHGIVEFLVFMVLGTLGVGKSALTKLLAVRLAPRMHSEMGRTIRIGAINLKRTHEIPEYEELAHYMGCRVISLKNARLNILDPAIGLSVEEHLANLVMVIQQIRQDTNRDRGGWISPIETKVLKTALVQLQQRDEHNLAELMRVLNDPAAIVPSIPGGETMRTIGNEVGTACVELTALLDQLYNGAYGNIFGGDNSILEDLSQKMVVLDYWGLTSPQVSLIQALLWSYRASAISRGDDRFRVEMSIDDENHELWKNPVYAAAMALHIATIREHGGSIYLNTHQLGDYVASGSEDAMNMIDKVAGLFIGASTLNSARALQERYDFSDKTRDRIVSLDKGGFCFYVPGEQEVFFRTILATEAERRICYSDGGHHSITGHQTT